MQILRDRWGAYGVKPLLIDVIDELERVREIVGDLLKEHDAYFDEGECPVAEGARAYLAAVRGDGEGA